MRGNRRLTNPARLEGLARLAGPALALLAFMVLVGAVAPAADQGPAIGPLIDHPTSEGVAASHNPLVGLLPLLIVALVVGLVVVAGAGYVLYRTRGTKIAPASDEWWTCGNCGAANVEGTARCHACATWRASAPRPSPTASR